MPSILCPICDGELMLVEPSDVDYLTDGEPDLCDADDMSDEDPIPEDYRNRKSLRTSTSCYPTSTPSQLNPKSSSSPSTLSDSQTSQGMLPTPKSSESLTSAVNSRRLTLGRRSLTRETQVPLLTGHALYSSDTATLTTPFRPPIRTLLDLPSVNGETNSERS